MFGIGVEGGASHDKSSSSQKVWNPQARALGGMYNQAGRLYHNQLGLQNQFQNFGMNTVNPYMASLNPYMMQGFGGLMGGGQQGQFAQQMSPELQASYAQSLGPQGPTNTQRMYQDIIGGQGNTYVDPLVDDMYNQAWKGLDRGAFKNSAQAAAQSGNMGNYSRQMDNSAYAADTMSDVRSKEMALRAGAYDKDLNWKMDIANMADSNALQDRMNAQRQLSGFMGAGDQNTMGALNQGQMMQQMGMGMMNPWMAMMQAPWNSLNNMANIIGDPTVLNNTTKKSGSWNVGVSV